MKTQFKWDYIPSDDKGLHECTDSIGLMRKLIKVHKQNIKGRISILQFQLNSTRKTFDH